MNNGIIQYSDVRKNYKVTYLLSQQHEAKIESWKNEHFQPRIKKGAIGPQNKSENLYFFNL